MDRRRFVGTLAGGLLAAPLATGAQPADRSYRIGFLGLSSASAYAPYLQAFLQGLRELGYDVEPFGGASTRLRAVPSLLGTRDPGPALAAILQDLAERDTAEWAVAGVRDRLAATLACHSAVRAGEPLQAPQMSAIVRDLFRTAHRTLCPHGRPTMVRVPREELSRWFGRTGWRRQ